MSNPNLQPDYQAATQWASNYFNNNNLPKKNTINIFWVTVIVLLLLLAVWWWWYNYYPKKNNNLSKLEKPETDKPSGKFLIKPDGTIVSN